MKQKIILLCIMTILCSSAFFDEIYAVKVPVTEDLPGANCTYERKDGSACTVAIDGKNCQLVCDSGVGFQGVLDIMGGIIKYFTFLAALGGVLLLVVGGIMYSMGGADDALKTKAKEQIQKTLIGLILLLLSGVILNMIAPWKYK